MKNMRENIRNKIVIIVTLEDKKASVRLVFLLTHLARASPFELASHSNETLPPARAWHQRVKWCTCYVLSGQEYW